MHYIQLIDCRLWWFCCCCWVTKSCLTLWPRGLQHTRLPYPSVSPGTCSNSCPLSQWWHQTIWSSAAPFASNLSYHQGLFQWIGCFWRKSWLIWNNLFSWCDFSESNCSLTIFRSHVNWTNCFGWVKDRDCSKMHIWHKTKILWMSVAFPKVILLSRLWKIIIILDYVLWDIGREKIIKVNSAKLNWKNWTIWVILCTYIIEDPFYGVTGTMNVLGPAKQFWRRHSKPAWLHCQRLMVINIFKMMLYIFNHLTC